MTGVLIYTRLSTEDLNESMDRQESSCRWYATARGWTVLDVLRDVDASAYLRGARRPGFEALVAEAGARTCDGVVVWKLDRLVRRPADFERLWEIAEQRGVFVSSVMEPVDSSSPVGLALLRILVALAGLESATTGVRIRSQRRQTAERGTPPPVKAFGMTASWDGIVEEEVAVLREAAERALAGERLASVARDFRARGLLSATGGGWTDASLGRMLRNPRLVGDRAYRGEVVARDCWPAAFDRDFFARVQLALNHPYRQGAPRKHGPRVASGFLFCGLCAQKMNTTTRGGERYYSCPPARTGCGRVHVKASSVEAWLLDQLLARLELEAPPAETVDTLEAATAMRELCRDYYVDRSIARDDFLSTRALLARQAETLSRASGRQREAARVLAAAQPRRALGALSIDVLRDLLGARLERVTVSRFTANRRGVFEAGRLNCEWIPNPTGQHARDN